MRGKQIATSQHVVLSGCSGGGKSTLLAELARRGFSTVAEPGRRIVEEEMHGEGTALPWIDLEHFARRAAVMASEDRLRTASLSGWIFFDRGLVDAVVALNHATGKPLSSGLERSPLYHSRVFMTPPWPEIYVTDNERQHGLESAVAEYDRLLVAYRALGYETIILPKLDVGERADFVLKHLPASE
jgi:predicted ATPase